MDINPSIALPKFGLAAAAALLTGVLIVQIFPALPATGFSIALLIVGLLTWWRGQRSLAIGGALLIGMAVAALHGQHALAQRVDLALIGGDIALQGRIVGLPQYEPDHIRFEIDVLSVVEKSASQLIDRRLRLGWYRNAPDLQPGDLLDIEVRLRIPRGVINPGSFDFEKFAVERRLAAVGYVRDGQKISASVSGWNIDALRDRLSEKIAEQLGPERARFVQALAVGDTRGLSDQDWDRLRVAGLTHLIAISGFHVGMVAAFAVLLIRLIYWCLPLLGRILPRPQAAAIAALLAAVGYTALAGFALPTVRTAVMIAAVVFSRLLRRRTTAAQTLAHALIAVLLFDALSVLAPGFWLSFAGVAWLLWCFPANSQASMIRSFFSAQAVATLGLLPICVWFFGQTSLIGPFVNLIGIPWISLIIVPLSLLGLLVDLVSSTAAGWLWQLAAILMDGFWQGLLPLTDSSLALIWLPEASILGIFLAMIGAFWLLLPRGVPAKWLAAVLLLPMLIPAQNLPEYGELDIAMIDVGQGLSLLMRTRDRAILYDAGPASPRGGLDFGEAAVVPALRALGVRRLDMIIASHGDNDHAGGIASVQRAFPDAAVFAPEGAKVDGAKVCQLGQRWRWGGVNVEILHPPPLLPYLRNESSCVLRIQTRDRSALLTGDIGKHIESRLIYEYPRQLHADLLIVPHHGSASSSTAAFVDAVAPKLALASYGYANRFGHPHHSTVNRYQMRNIDWIGSATAGFTKLRLDSNGVHIIERRRLDQRRWWRHQ